MLVPARLNALPGLLLAALPPVAVAGFGLALVSLAGGRAAVWRMANVAGPDSTLLGVAVLGVTLLLSALLSMGPSGRHAPLVVLVGLATLPWLLGIAATQEAVETVLAALPETGNGDTLAVLEVATGEAMVMRLLGAWMSAALLVSVAVGLVVMLRRAALVGEDAGRLLGAGLGLALGCIALMVALEAHQLFELLTTLATQAPEARAGLIAAGSAKLTHLQTLRSATLGALTVLALALVCWQFFLRPEAVTQWAGSLLLVALAAAVLILDARPMRLAQEAEALRPLASGAAHLPPPTVRGANTAAAH